jgi:hypothetical protein
MEVHSAPKPIWEFFPKNHNLPTLFVACAILYWDEWVSCVQSTKGIDRTSETTGISIHSCPCLLEFSVARLHNYFYFTCYMTHTVHKPSQHLEETILNKLDVLSSVCFQVQSILIHDVMGSWWARCNIERNTFWPLLLRRWLAFTCLERMKEWKKERKKERKKSQQRNLVRTRIGFV